MDKKIPLRSLVILMIAAIDNIRNLPAAALFGSSLILFFILAALLFLIPVSLVAAELSSAFPKTGGIYHWVDRAFGKKMGMAAIWLQWVNTVIWYPTVLSFIAGTLGYLIHPGLVENKTFLITFILVVFWGLTLFNLKGVYLSAIVNNACCLFGSMVPLCLLIGLGAIWVLKGEPLQITFALKDFVPPINSSTSWVSLIAIMASFTGMELAGVHVNDIKDPQRNFPKAALISCLFIFFSMTLGSLAIAFVIPEKEINLISGVMQMVDGFFKAFHLEPLTPIVGGLIVIGSIGLLINWLISPAKGLLHAAESGFLPAVFAKTNKDGVAYNILFAQATIVTLMCFLFLFEPNVGAFYWFLTAISTELYMIMYALMFAAALYLHYTHQDRKDTFKIPGKTIGIWLVCLLGAIGSLATIIVSFIPPDNVQYDSHLQYLVTIVIGNILCICPLAIFYRYRKKALRQGELALTN